MEKVKAKDLEGIYFEPVSKRLISATYLPGYDTLYIDNVKPPFFGAHVSIRAFQTYLDENFYIKATEAIKVLYG